MLPGHTPILIHDVLGQTYAVTCWRRPPSLDLSKRDVFSEDRTYARQVLRSVASLQEHDPFNYRLYDIWQMVYQKPWTRPATLDDLIDDLAEAAHTGRLFGYLEYSPVYEALEASSGPGGGMAQGSGEASAETPRVAAPHSSASAFEGDVLQSPPVIAGKLLPASKAVLPTSLTEAESLLRNRRSVIAKEGYKPKYSDVELVDLAQAGNVGQERFQVRFMEAAYLVDRSTPQGPLSGKMGAVMKGKSGEGAKYWSTSFDQLEDADTDPKLISHKLGLEYDPAKSYVLMIVDHEKAAPLTGVKSVPATFEKVSEFANTELPVDFPKEFTDQVMTPEFQKKYAKHYQAAVESGDLPTPWSKDTRKFNDYLESTNLSRSEKSLLISRMVMHDKIGNNQDYLGNGLTKALGNHSENTSGVVEILNFERSIVSLKELDDAGGVLIIEGLEPV